MNKEARINAALLCAAALAGAVLVVRAECGNQGPSSNDAEVACHNCATGAWSTGACTWHLAESGDAYCGVCLPGFNCAKVGTHPSEKVITYSNAECSPTGCIGGDPQTDPNATPDKNSASSCGG